MSRTLIITATLIIVSGYFTPGWTEVSSAKNEKVPSGTRFSIRLESAVSDRDQECALRATIVDNLVASDGVILIPAGSVLKGHAGKSITVWQKDKLRAISLKFESITLPNNRQQIRLAAFNLNPVLPICRGLTLPPYHPAGCTSIGAKVPPADSGSSLELCAAKGKRAALSEGDVLRLEVIKDIVVNDDLASLPPSTSAKATTARPREVVKFDSDRWRHDPSHWDTRRLMLDDLMANYNLVGMTRPELYRLLGHPEEGASFHSYARYFIYFPGYDSCVFLECAFSEDKVTKCRIDNPCSAERSMGRLFANFEKTRTLDIGEWAAAPSEKAKDDVALAIAKEKGQMRVSTVHLQLSEDERLLKVIHDNLAKHPSDYETAIDASSKYLKLFPTDRAMWEKQGFIHGENKQFQKAAQDYSEALKLYKEQPNNCLEDRARIFMKLKKYDKAIADYTAALELLLPGGKLRARVAPEICDFRAGRTLAGRGLAELKLGQPEKAVQDFDQSIFLLRRDVSGPRQELYLWRARAYDELSKNDLANADRIRAKELERGGRNWSFDIDDELD